LKRVKRRGLHTEIDFGFDPSKILTPEQLAAIKKDHPESQADMTFGGSIAACGAPNDLPEYKQPEPQEKASNYDIQVFLIEANESLRIGLRNGLRSREGIEIYSEATNADTGLVLLKSVGGGDVALVDMSLPDRDGGELTKEFREVQKNSDNPDLKICLLIDDSQPTEIDRALMVEADSYCLKNAPLAKIADMVRQTYRGHSYLDSGIACYLLSTVKKGSAEVFLTPEEKDVLELIGAEAHYDAIASQLGITIEQVNGDIKNILSQFRGYYLNNQNLLGLSSVV
jgi:anaerobic magnesium-protoporphyrin IX monomethyl ester cyclase